MDFAAGGDHFVQWGGQFALPGGTSADIAPDQLARDRTPEPDIAPIIENDVVTVQGILDRLNIAREDFRVDEHIHVNIEPGHPNAATAEFDRGRLTGDKEIFPADPVFVGIDHDLTASASWEPVPLGAGFVVIGIGLELHLPAEAMPERHEAAGFVMTRRSGVFMIPTVEGVRLPDRPHPQEVRICVEH